MKPSKYQIFIKAYELGSFSKAAEELNYTQSAISQTIQSLENEIGKTLFHRNKKGVTLTSDGEYLLPFIYGISDAERQFQDAVYVSNNEYRRKLRIGAYPTASETILPDAISAFQAHYPNIQYEIISGNYHEIEQLILSGGVDLGFIRMDNPYQLDLFPLPAEPLVVIMSEESRFRELNSIDISALQNEPLLILDDGYTEIILDYFRKNNIDLSNIKSKIKGNITLLNFVKKNLGYSIVPISLAETGIPGVIMKPLFPPLERRTAIACQDKTKLNAVEKLFLKEVLESGGKGM